MTDQPEMDPTATFRLDQEAAENEAKTRDEVGWELHVQDAQAQIAMKVAAAENETAKANLRQAIVLTLYAALSLGGTIALVWAIAQAVQAVVGWFQ